MKRFIAFLCAVSLLALAAGCGNKSSDKSAQALPDKQAQIKAIQNNPHISPQMKAGIIQRIQQQQKTGTPNAAKK